MVKRHYPEAPLVGVGGIVIDGRRAAVVQRGREPAKGMWSIPGGLVELGEELTQAAAREIEEECNLLVQVGPLVEVVERIDIDPSGLVAHHYVIHDYLCRLISGTLKSGHDAADAKWVDLDNLADLVQDAYTRRVILKAAAMNGDW